jgi:DNA polymerase III alpha subunit
MEKKRQTFDIEMIEEPRNFIANNFVSHNSYGFNKSHAVEYSMISYWCGWLKYYYPKNFYKSILKYEVDNKLISATMQEMENKNIHLEFPDINHSDFSFSIFNNKIYCGLNTIKGLGEKTAEKIINNRPYISKKDFLQKTKVSQKIFKGLEVADSFREIEEIKQEHSLQELLKYTKIKPKNKIKDVYDFGNLPFKDICNLTEEDKNKPTVLRGIITEVVNKDKLLRKTLDDFKIKFEKHMIYLNLNDGTDDLALQVDPGHYQFLKNKIERAENQLVIAVGILNNDGKKMYLEELEFLNDPIENRKITKTFEENKKNKPGETFIASAQPKVSKKGKSYYNIILFNGIKGMCFFFDEALKFGDKVKEYRTKDSFINLIIDKK